MWPVTGRFRYNTFSKQVLAPQEPSPTATILIVFSEGTWTRGDCVGLSPNLAKGAAAAALDSFFFGLMGESAVATKYSISCSSTRIGRAKGVIIGGVFASCPLAPPLDLIITIRVLVYFKWNYNIANMDNLHKEFAMATQRPLRSASPFLFFLTQLTQSWFFKYIKFLFLLLYLFFFVFFLLLTKILTFVLKNTYYHISFIQVHKDCMFISSLFFFECLCYYHPFSERSSAKFL